MEKEPISYTDSVIPIVHGDGGTTTKEECLKRLGLLQKGGALMTLEELRKKLNKIPETGIINQARRMAIIVQINKLMQEEE